MGKGDKKSRRGKITNGSYGKRRPRKSSVPVTVTETSTKAKPAAKPKTTKPKAEKTETAETKPKTTRKKKTEE